MRVWVDLTNSPHVLVMRPMIEAMREDGHEVEVTARAFAQTLELCERFGIAHAVIGRHRGRVASKGLGLASRSLALALEWLAGEDVQAVVLPRTRAQADEVRRMGAFTVPARAVSAGGTMNREAVALGTPVYTTFEGRLGAVDEVLLHEGRLHKLGDPAEIVVKRRQAHGELRIRRDPRELVKLLLSGTES
ncbi:MAG TPA: DUF354 domain-containing protein [Thermoleophilaceae bacterium]